MSRRALASAVVARCWWRVVQSLIGVMDGSVGWFLGGALYSSNGSEGVMGEGSPLPGAPVLVALNALWWEGKAVMESCQLWVNLNSAGF